MKECKDILSLIVREIIDVVAWSCLPSSTTAP